jgi:hypothetical protein
VTISIARWPLALAALMSLVLTPSMASAQAAAPPQLPGLSSSALQTVYVLDRSGMETSGKLLGIDPDSLVLLVDGSERRFEMSSVARVQKRDSLKNGTLIGAAVGIAMGLISAGISDCPGDDPGGSCAGARAAVFAVSVGVYSGLGAGVDALVRGRTTIYSAPASSNPSLTRTFKGASSPRPVLEVGFSW